MHELCYATSKSPTKDFVYQGVIVSNCDLHIDSYKPADMQTYFKGNNHGGMVDISGQWYIYYHWHTNGTCFSRQGCAEPINISEDGTIKQVEMTSCGLNNGPLKGRGEYPAYLACNLFSKSEVNEYPAHYDAWIDGKFPKITQDGNDGDEEIGYIANIRDSTIAGFKYFDCNGITKIKIKTRGYGQGSFEVRTKWNGESLGSIAVEHSNTWIERSADIQIPDGIQCLYFEFKGEGGPSLASFHLG